MTLAIDLIGLAIDGAYDVGVIASTDTDLVPALEFVLQRFHGSPRVEVTAWTGTGRRPRLSSRTHKIWCHWLNQVDYDTIHDPADYTI